MNELLDQEAKIQDEVDALRPQFIHTRDLYREVCALLFFRYGITPTTNKLYQLVKKGSMSVPTEVLSALGANKQKVLKFHGILANLLFRKAYRRFLTSQILADFKGSFLRAYNPTESIIFSSEKSYSPCKLKWLHRMTESFRMASMSSFLRSSLLSLPSSFAR